MMSTRGKEAILPPYSLHRPFVGTFRLVVIQSSLLLASITLGVVCQPVVAAESGGIEQPVVGDAKTQSTLKVFGSDERQVVADTTQFPWSAIGILQSTWKPLGGQQLVSSGTGVLVGSNIVLTGGHCIYDQIEGWADEVVFIPGANDNQEPFGRAHSIRMISQRGWVESDDHRYDLALIVLDKPIGEQAGFMSYAAQPDSFFVDRLLNTAGYPAETKSGNIQYFTSGSSLDVQDGLIRDMLDSEPGQSGSPIWYYQTNPVSRTLVGVLTGNRQSTTGGQAVSDYNVAVQIDEGFAKWISDTRATYDTGTSANVQPRADLAAPTPACGAGLTGTGLLAMGLMCARGISGRWAPASKGCKSPGWQDAR